MFLPQKLEYLHLETPLHSLRPLQGMRKRSCQKHKYVTRNLHRYDFYLKRILLHTATDVSSRSNNAITKRSENKAHGENTCATHADSLTYTNTQRNIHKNTRSLSLTRCANSEAEKRTHRLQNICHNTFKFMSSGDYVSVLWLTCACQSVSHLSLCPPACLPAWLSWPALSSIVLGGATTTKGSNNGWLRSFSSLVGFICCIRSYLSSIFHVCIRVCVRVCTHTLCIGFDIHKYIFDTSVRVGSSVSGSLESQKSKFVAASMWLCDPCVSNK